MGHQTRRREHIFVTETRPRPAPRAPQLPSTTPHADPHRPVLYPRYICYDGLRLHGTESTNDVKSNSYGQGQDYSLITHIPIPIFIVTKTTDGGIV